MSDPVHPVLCPRRKDLADQLGVAPGYISAMRRAGLPRNADAAAARIWLSEHPEFRKRAVYPSREHKGTGGNTREPFAL